jgi:hypothetical protein
MTNLTNSTTNSTNSGSKAMNNTAKISAMSQVIFNKGLMPKQAIALSAALIEMKEKIGHSNWERVMSRTIRNIPFVVDGMPVSGIEIDGWVDTLVSSNLISRDDEGVLSEGPYLIALYEEKEKSYPRAASEGIVDRRRKLKNNNEGMVETIKVLEDTKYVVDEVMLKLGMSVYAKLGQCKLTSEQYVIDGSYHLVNEGNVPVVSEFFDDNRGRVYQGDGHGPNGQSSDMARSFMNLHGVSTDYDVGVATSLILSEMADMCSLSEQAILDEVSVIGGLTFQGVADWMVTNLKDNRSPIKKVWSFVKAAGLLIKMGRGETPYIGMAFGLDAKCSGPQLASLMTDDEALAQACGFTTEQVDDAYRRAIKQLNGSWAAVERNDIKKPYMATFYGQSWQALTRPENYGRVKKSDMEMTVLDCMLNGAGVTRETNPSMVAEIVFAHWDERAKEFSEAIEKSFGKVSNLRKAVKDAHGYWEQDMEGNPVWTALTNKATTHAMPDGVKVRMPYFTTVDINNVKQEYGMLAPTLEIIVKGEDMKFNMMTFKTKEVDLARHGRTGFVNMVQATDAQLARLIIRNLDSLGAEHVVAVHDCFRVNIIDMIDGKLEKAIMAAYMALFGSVANERTEMLPRGTDITGMYFKGVNKSRESAGYVHSQFEDGERTLHDFMDIPALIEDLGNTTYFAK